MASKRVTLKGLPMRFLAVSIAAVLAFSASPATAQCIGTGSLRTCTDQYGNTYTTTRMGNTSTTHGSNARTGSSWNQQSFRTGNMTTTHGTDSQGRSWNSTSTPYGTYGTDAEGNSFYAPNLGTNSAKRKKPSSYFDPDW